MDLFLDPRLRDNYTTIQAGQSGLPAFLGEQIALVKGADLSRIDFDYLGSVTLPQTWDMKKLQVGKVLKGETVLDMPDAERFTEQLKALRATAVDLLASLLPDCSYVPNLVVRFSETRMENLHYDMDAGSDDHEAFRLYINLDRAPRIWNTSYTLTDLIQNGGRRLWGGVPEGSPSEAYLKRITTRAYGGWHQRATERLSPRHMAFFDPGDVWLVDGRCVSHQVITGHRVLSVYCKLSYAENPHLAPTFAEKLRTAMAEAPDTSSPYVGDFDPHSLGKANVREDWGSVFGETRTGGIRRFDDTGLRAE